jgi:hypothetical protein
MEKDRMPKKTSTQELEGSRRRGRPRKGWKEEVERDLRVLGMRRWRELVTGKNGRTLFDRPKPTAGCTVNGRRTKKKIYIYTYIMQVKFRLESVAQNSMYST